MIRSAFLLLSFAVSVDAGSQLMDSAGGLRLNIPSISTGEGVVSVISSPGTSSFLSTSDDVLSLDSESPPSLICRGATLSGTSSVERSALATCSVVSGAIVVDGITEGDVEAGWRNSRHARTLTALFRARIALESDAKQTLILCIKGEIEKSAESGLRSEVKALFDATAAESEGKASFSDYYDVKVLSVTDGSEAEEAMQLAREAAAENAGSETTLAAALEQANERVRASGIASVALDPPHVAQAFVAVGNAYSKYARTARAKIVSWKNRVARGLWVEGFSNDAETLRKRVLGSFDSETLAAAGLPLVAPYRLEMRSQLASLLDSSIREVFASQVTNLEKSTIKKLRAQLLKKLDVPPEDAPSENAAALRAASFSFDSTMNDLEVPSLGLTKAKACREMESKLTDEVMSFADSPIAQIKRMKKVTKVTSKEKKPGQRSIDFGLDLVAMLRPDGFGSLQGFAGYQLGGNSVTFGIHNDADDPQTIAQFGGVRPPLLRVQPKLRVDVEM